MKALLVLISFVLGLNSLQADCINSEFVIAATGDTIFHGSLYVQAYKDNPEGDYKTIWDKTMPFLQQADLMYTNIEGPVAPGLYPSGKTDFSLAEIYHPSNGMYSVGEAGRSYTFNFHPQSIRELVDEGFTLFSLANNHSLDRGLKGVDLSLDFFENFNDIHYFGTKDSHDDDLKYISYVIHKNYQLSFISCTYGNNNNLKNNQVLLCYENGQPNPLLIDIVQQAKEKSDAVIVTPHWGNEYSKKPSSHQQKLAQALVDAGAKAIIGHHPHVIQPVEYIKNSEDIDVPVMYSLGNFVSNQAPSNWKDPEKNESRFKRRVGATAFLGFSYIKGELQANELKLLPTYMKIIHEGKKGIRKLLPAYSSLFGTDSMVKKSLEKAQKHFLQSIDSSLMFNDQDLQTSLRCH